MSLIDKVNFISHKNFSYKGFSQDETSGFDYYKAMSTLEIYWCSGLAIQFCDCRCSKLVWVSYQGSTKVTKAKHKSGLEDIAQWLIACHVFNSPWFSMWCV